MTKPETKQLSITLPESLHDRLEAVSAERLVGKSAIVQRAVEDLLAKLAGSDPLGGPDA
jgi:metal-responsive CopG/Arc/MetJ family transcriptional regulator